MNQPVGYTLPVRFGDLTLLRETRYGNEPGFVCRCERCHRELIMRAHNLWKRRIFACQRCACSEGGKAGIVKRRTAARYCSICRAPDHDANTCSKRKKARYCERCFGQAHRVEGIRCECGLLYAPIVVAKELETGMGNWRWT